MDYERARELAGLLVERLDWSGDQVALVMARSLLDMIEPPLTMPEILALVPGRTLREKQVNAQISRSTWYNLTKGDYRPSQPVANRLAQLTGVSFDVIMRAEQVRLRRADYGGQRRSGVRASE